jgi:uncharacterized protein YndB with AHSA1/START domain
MRRWMLPPPGWTMTRCECEARVGGKVFVAWKSDEADPAMTLQGEFIELTLHEHAVHTETMALGSGQTVGSLVEQHQFIDQGGATAMIITQTFAAKEDRDGALASGMDQGMEACYQQLDALLGVRS